MSGDAAVLALGGRGSPESTGIAADLWQDSSNATAIALHSPFVKGLADGSLPKYAVNPAAACTARSKSLLCRRMLLTI